MKKDISNTTQTKRVKPGTTPRARESQLLALAMDVAEQKLRDGTASSQLIVEVLKRGSDKYALEIEKLKEENQLLKAKTEAIKNSEVQAEFYSEVIKAMRLYSGQDTDDSEEIVDE